MSRKEAQDAAERTKKMLLWGGIGVAGWLLLRPKPPVLNNLAVADDNPQWAEGYTAFRALEPYLPGAGEYGFAGLGEVLDMTTAVLPVTDAADAPIKLRRIQVVRADSSVSTNSLRAITQNTQQRARRANRDIPSIVQGVVKRYGRIIQQAAALHNVPAQIIATKICIENPDMLASVVTGGGATGIMQIAPGTADTCLRTEYRKGHLTDMEAEYFRLKLGPARWAALLRGQNAIRITDLQKPEFNIHIGTLAFGQMLRKYTNLATGEVELYKAAAEYNRGIRAEGPNKVVSSPDQLIAYRNGKLSTPPITQQYIMLYCGPGGPLDYITRNNLLA
ncbi:hypothetical protein EI290_20680 [Hymenobacter metallilatus]|uniref:Uncharacterized protein n=2 Tax=Hymenobacter metallilatus TaxID=2493666 RepID=A0A428IYK6_9BACT|nr:hypothetical protein EI290_20680 [Hymenobacter metallilatus]